VNAEHGMRTNDSACHALMAHEAVVSASSVVRGSDSVIRVLQARAHEALRADALWKVTAYRLALYAIEIGWEDARVIDRSRIARPIASQLYRALGSTAANIAEGYSRSSGPDRARHFEYSLGSARESLAWYFAVAPVLGRDPFAARNDALAQIRRLLLTSIPVERKRPRLCKK
jgi:four helix bundle protein